MQVVASSYWQAVPVNPMAHAQLPFVCAMPCALHVVASLYWHAVPVAPVLQAHAPVAPHAPWPLHVIMASQNVQLGYP